MFFSLCFWWWCKCNSRFYKANLQGCRASTPLPPPSLQGCSGGEVVVALFSHKPQAMALVMAMKQWGLGLNPVCLRFIRVRSAHVRLYTFLHSEPHATTPLWNRKFVFGPATAHRAAKYSWASWYLLASPNTVYHISGKRCVYRIYSEQIQYRICNWLSRGDKWMIFFCSRVRRPFSNARSATHKNTNACSARRYTRASSQKDATPRNSEFFILIYVSRSLKHTVCEYYRTQIVFFFNCFLLEQWRLTCWDFCFLYDTQSNILAPFRWLWGSRIRTRDSCVSCLVSPSCLS
jgi:hypothetical protein